MTICGREHDILEVKLSSKHCTELSIERSN